MFCTVLATGDIPTSTSWSVPWSEASVVVLPHWFVALVWSSLVLVTFSSLKANKSSTSGDCCVFRPRPGRHLP